MQTPFSKRAIGCIGKCTSGLSREELDQITDNVDRTLFHPRGRLIFKEYLRQRNLEDYIESLNLYEACCTYIENEQSRLRSRNEPSLSPLTNDVAAVRDMAMDVNVPLIDKALMKEFKKALESESRNELLSVLEDTKDRCRDHLGDIHGRFKRYASEPCPLNKR